MIALRAAMRCTPIASVMVISAGRPSGIAATAKPTTAEKIVREVHARHLAAEGEQQHATPRSRR